MWMCGLCSQAMDNASKQEHHTNQNRAWASPPASGCPRPPPSVAPPPPTRRPSSPTRAAISGWSSFSPLRPPPPPPPPPGPIPLPAPPSASAGPPSPRPQPQPLQEQQQTQPRESHASSPAPPSTARRPNPPPPSSRPVSQRRQPPCQSPSSFCCWPACVWPRASRPLPRAQARTSVAKRQWGDKPDDERVV